MTRQNFHGLPSLHLANHTHTPQSPACMPHLWGIVLYVPLLTMLLYMYFIACVTVVRLIVFSEKCHNLYCMYKYKEVPVGDIC